MPIGPRARFEGNVIRSQPCRGLAGDDRILPDRADKKLFRPATCRARSGEMDIRRILLRCFYSAVILKRRSCAVSKDGSTLNPSFETRASHAPKG